MSPTGPEGERYQVYCSQAILLAFQSLQRQAKAERRGQSLLAATKVVQARLRVSPTDFGEPLYHLPAMRLQIRSAVVRPLVVHFAVCDDRPVVFIKAVKLLDKHRSKEL